MVINWHVDAGNRFSASALNHRVISTTPQIPNLNVFVSFPERSFLLHLRHCRESLRGGILEVALSESVFSFGFKLAPHGGAPLSSVECLWLDETGWTT